MGFGQVLFCRHNTKLLSIYNFVKRQKIKPILIIKRLKLQNIFLLRNLATPSLNLPFPLFTSQIADSEGAESPMSFLA